MIGGLFKGAFGTARLAGGGFMAFVGGLSSIMAMVLGIAIGIGVWHLRYEGFPVPWPITYIWEGGGKIREVEREASRAERAKCEAEKEASRIAAEKFDGEEQARHLASMAKQLQDAQRRADDVRDEFDRYKADTEADDTQEVAAGRRAGCEPLTRRGAAGLQPRQLPYPGTGQDQDRGAGR